MDEEAIFAAALEKTGPAERAAFLEGACGGDAAMRRRIERLIEAHEKTLGILDQSPGPPGWAESRHDSARAGIVIADRYKLLEEIGAGGMGTVWKAEQTQPVRRVVALKLIRAGMDSRTVLARFEAERQALALMEHPNIARVLDGGTTAEGRPFFVMEYVQGVPITDYCDDARLSIAERLALFLPVCQAVQHAHNKGVIHRDLKPSNILVCLYDGQPVPKVIDFGLAKAIQEPLTERTLHTAHGAVLGTPLYMSPEQAEVNNLDVDARSDIYALGVILYELLTGTTPLERGRFREAAWNEMLRVIREEDPPRPSARLSGSDSLPTLAAQRRMEPVRLTRLVRGELDWVVMKCLEKDRSRRYETASSLARDVQRYLTDESVEARPPSPGYLLGKFVRRNRGPTLAAATILLLLVGGIVGTSWGLIQARRAWKAESERAEGERKANEQAQKRLRQIEKGNEILGSVFQDLNPRDEEKGGKPLRALLGDRLVHAAEQLDGDAVGDPLLVSTMQNRLGVSLLHLGLPRQAIPVLEKARATRAAGLGDDDDVTLETSGLLAEAYRADGKPDKALPLLEENLKLTKARKGPDAPDTLICLNNLAGFYQEAGRLTQAIAIHEEVLRLKRARLGEDDPQTLISMNNLANAYRAENNLDKAIPLLKETLRLRRNRLGPTHISTLASMNNLAEGHRAEGRPDLALPLQEETLRLLRSEAGPTHPNTLVCMSNLGRTYLAVRQPDRAVPVLEEALRLMRAGMNPDHPHVLLCMGNLATAYLDIGASDRALPLLQEVTQTRKARLGDEDPATLHALSNLASGYQAAGKPDRALPTFEEVLRLRKARLSSDHPDVLTSLNNLAGAYRASNEPGRAEALYREAAAGIERLKFRHPGASQVVHNLIDSLERSKRFDEAETWRRKWLKVMREGSGADSLPYAEELAGLGANLMRQGEWPAADTALREALGLFERKAPEILPRFEVQSRLGEALLGQRRYVDAEPLLLGAFEGIEAREAHLPPAERRRVAESGRRIVRLYEAWGQAEKAAGWRSKLVATGGVVECKP